MSRIQAAVDTEFPPSLCRKDANDVRKMRIYFGSVATRSEVHRNVGRISVDERIRPKRCGGPDRSDQECSTFWNGFYPSKLWVIRR